MKKTGQQRFAIFGVLVAVFTPVAARAAKELGWIPSKTDAIIFAVGMGLFCILGGIIAYRTTQAQVRRDLDEVHDTGKIR